MSRKLSALSLGVILAALLFAGYSAISGQAAGRQPAVGADRRGRKPRKHPANLNPRYSISRIYLQNRDPGP